jgi:hypothetical protein
MSAYLQDREFALEFLRYPLIFLLNSPLFCLEFYRDGRTRATSKKFHMRLHVSETAVELALIDNK